MSSRFRDQVARDRAWANHYARAGLRVPVMKDAKSTPNAYRIANYMLRAASHNAALRVSESPVHM